MLVEKIYILGALLKLPFFTHDEEMKNWANSYLTFHSYNPPFCERHQSGYETRRPFVTSIILI